MKFVRIGDDTFRLDMIVRIREGKVNETQYGRSVRKTADHIGWIEVHFVVGEMLKIMGPAAELLRSLLEEEYGVRDLSLPTPNEWGDTPDSAPASHDRALGPPSSLGSY